MASNCVPLGAYIAIVVGEFLAGFVAGDAFGARRQNKKFAAFLNELVAVLEGRKTAAQATEELKGKL